MSFSALLLASALMFSDTRGSVHGKVWDPTGAVVVGAIVTAENIIDGHSWVARTNNEGEYELDYVQTGHYRLKAEVRGFQTAVQYTIIGAGQRVEVNFHLILSVMPAGEVSVAHPPVSVNLRSTSVESTFSAPNVAFSGAPHIRGAHQVGYQVNGIAIQDLSSFEPLTPFIDLRYLKFAEV